MNRQTIAALVAVEERFAYVQCRRGLSWRQIADLSALPIHEGGLGRRIPPAVASIRSGDYRRRLEAALLTVQGDEAERRAWDVDVKVRRALDDLYAAALGSRARYLAERRHERWTREERRLHGFGEFDSPAPPPPVTRWMREHAALSVAMEVDDALAAFHDDDRQCLRETLRLDVEMDTRGMPGGVVAPS